MDLDRTNGLLRLGLGLGLGLCSGSGFSALRFQRERHLPLHFPLILNLNRVRRKTARQLSAKTRRDVFERVWKEIADHYYDRSFNGVDWNEVHARYKPLVEAAKDNREFYSLMSRMTASCMMRTRGSIRRSSGGTSRSSRGLGRG